MTGDEYKEIIDGFDVENNPKYQKHDGLTFCNIFAQDVAAACGYPLPSGVCATMLDNLWGNKWSPWYSVTFDEAQVRANDGHPTIAITSDHVAIVRPNDDGSRPTERKQVRITQAGASLLNDSTLNYGWYPSQLDTIRFYSVYEQYA